MKVVGFSLATLFCIFQAPYLPVPELDASWQVVLEKAFFEHWEFGNTVNFTGGPLSLLYTPTSMGYYPVGQMRMEALIHFLVLCLVFGALSRQTVWVSVLGFSGLFLGSVIGKDGIYLAGIVAGSMSLLETRNRGWQIVIPAFFAVLSLVKFTFATLSIGCLVLVCAGQILEKRNWKALQPLGVYAGALLLLWVSIGQQLGNLPGFFINSWFISQGYLQNMQLQEAPAQTYYLLMLEGICIIPILVVCLRNRRDFQAWSVLAILGCGTFLAWKAGITRAGSHLSIFLITGFIAALTCLPLVKGWRWKTAWIAVLLVSFFNGYQVLLPGGWPHIMAMAPRFLKSHWEYLTMEDAVYHHFTKLIPVLKFQHELKETKAIVGDSTVDMLQAQQAILLLNDMNYHPRPTIQHYHGFNRHLLELNLKHAQNDPPEFLLSQFYPVDQRFPFSDDSLFNRDVFTNYQPLLTENGYLLLQRRDNLRIWQSDETVFEKEVYSMQEVDISAYADDLLWMTIDYRPSLVHRIAAFFYKPEILWLEIHLASGEKKVFRLPAGVLDSGFLLNPLLKDNKAFESFLKEPKVNDKITSFLIATTPGLTPRGTNQFGVVLKRVEISDY
ncbi:MAG: hypothetical protein KJT03_00890 [Verrucomicrobiae bacterium]|nr:hypothetical protein [Verrucomicrobiae bacterium]